MEIQFFQFFPANAGCTVEIAGIYHAAKKFSVLRVHQNEFKPIIAKLAKAA